MGPRDQRSGPQAPSIRGRFTQLNRVAGRRPPPPPAGPAPGQAPSTAHPSPPGADPDPGPRLRHRGCELWPTKPLRQPSSTHPLIIDRRTSSPAPRASLPSQQSQPSIVSARGALQRLARTRIFVIYVRSGSSFPDNLNSGPAPLPIPEQHANRYPKDQYRARTMCTPGRNCKRTLETQLAKLQRLRPHRMRQKSTFPFQTLISGRVVGISTKLHQSQCAGSPNQHPEKPLRPLSPSAAQCLVSRDVFEQTINLTRICRHRTQRLEKTAGRPYPRPTEARCTTSWR